MDAGRVLYVRAPGLLARAAIQGRSGGTPLAVGDGRAVRDACPRARERGVTPGESVVQARRLCPSLLVIPRETLDSRPLSRRLWDLLADLSPVVEPDGPDAAFADMQGDPVPRAALENAVSALTGLPPLLGVGPCKAAARALAAAGLTADRLGAAPTEWLWPEDAKVVARLGRLGLDTFGQVAALREEDLCYQFGRLGRLLHRRARGGDLDTVRADYPPPRADDELAFDEYPLTDWTMLQAALARLAHAVSGQLMTLGRVGRKIVLRVGTERGEVRGEWTTPTPIQASGEVTRASQRLLMTLPLAAPITSLRLLVEELETALAVTGDLFAGRSLGNTRALDAAWRMLQGRYGPDAVRLLGALPRDARARRRDLERDAWGSVH